MVLPDDLLRLAALGTNKSGQSNTDASDTAREPEAEILLQALKVKLSHEAGYQPNQLRETDLRPAPEETARPCNGRALRQLLLMVVDGKFKKWLPIWLDEMIASNQCLPAEVLPLLMSHGNTHPQLREQLLPVLGERGKWLARVSGRLEWLWVLNPVKSQLMYDETQQWDSDFVQFRLHHADAAREALQANWAKVEDKRRAWYIEKMKHGLSDDDKPFLEAIVAEVFANPAHKRRFVAGVNGARLLATFPDSDLHDAARAAVEDMLIIARVGHDNQWVIDFAWSTVFDGHSDYRRREYALSIMQQFDHQWIPEYILSFVPLSYWYERWQVTPAILIEGAKNGTHPASILNAWGAMALLEDDHEFAYEALRQLRPNRLWPEGLEELIGILTPEEKEAIAIMWLDDKRLDIREHHPTNHVIMSIEHRWSEELMLAFLASLERSFAATARPLLQATHRDLIEHVSTYFALDMLDEVKRILQLNRRPELTDTEREIMDGIIAGLDFYPEIIRSIRNREA